MSAESEINTGTAFIKMEGLGNDFVMVSGPTSVSPERIQNICDRRHGVGADGLIVVTVEKSTPTTKLVMEYWNADGEPAEICGNGLRCAAKWALAQNLCSPSDEFVIESSVGSHRVREIDAEITVEIGVPKVSDQPLLFDQNWFWTVDIGNPHAVCKVESIDPDQAAVAGEQLERETAGGTNVEFVQVIDPENIEVAVWERGVGTTLACGTGGVAAVAVGRAEWELADRVQINFPGGQATVYFEDSVAWLTGPARTVFAGTWPQPLN